MLFEIPTLTYSIFIKLLRFFSVKEITSNAAIIVSRIFYSLKTTVNSELNQSAKYLTMKIH